MLNIKLWIIKNWANVLLCVALGTAILWFIKYSPCH